MFLASQIIRPMASHDDSSGGDCGPGDDGYMIGVNLFPHVGRSQGRGCVPLLP